MCNMCVTLGGYSHCIACVTASTLMVRPMVMAVTLWVPLSSCTVVLPCMTLNPEPDWSLKL